MVKENLEAMPGKHSIDSLQKTAILGTSHIIWKIVQCETWSLYGEDKVEFQQENLCDKRCDDYIDDDDDDDDSNKNNNMIPSR